MNVEEVLVTTTNFAPFVWTHPRIASLILVVIDALATFVVKGQSLFLDHLALESEIILERN